MNIRLALAAALVLLLGTPCFALPAFQPLGDLKHTGWTIESGAPSGIQALAQSSDGYLLAGASLGLFRFDGVSFEHVTAPAYNISRSDVVSALQTLPNGDTWVGYRSGDLAIYRNGRMLPLDIPRREGAAPIRMIAADRMGGVWVIRDYGKGELLHYQHSKWSMIDSSSGLPATFIDSILVGHDGTLWVAQWDAIYYLPGGSHHFVRSPEPLGRHYHTGLGEDRFGRIWISDDKSVRVLPQDRTKSSRQVPGDTFLPIAPHGGVYRIMFDRDGNLWGTSRSGGVYRIASPDVRPKSQPERYRASDGLTSNSTAAMVEDREGNMWIATAVGLDSFRLARAVPARDLPGAYSVGSDYGVVFAMADHTLFRIPPGGRAKVLMKIQDLLFMCEDGSGGWWVGILGRLHHLQGVELRPVPIPGPAGPNGGVVTCQDDYQGNLWLFHSDGRLLRRSPAGAWSNFPLENPKRDAGIGILRDPRGRILLQSRDKIQRIDFPNVTTVWSGPLGPIGAVQWLWPDGDDLYAIGETGITRIRNGKASSLRRTDYPELSLITGFVRSRGETWIMNSVGLLHTPLAQFDAAFERPGSPLRFSVIDMTDGLPGAARLGDRHDLAAGADGRLWVVTDERVARIDPADIVINRLAPPVLIKAVTAGGKRYIDPASVRLDKGAKNIAIDYTALSLTMPSRVRFRYQLEGVDQGWVDAGARRQAFYTNLAPGHYRFRVIAANEDGIWNTKGAALAFTLPPTFVQSAPFKLVCAAAILGLLWLAYALRLRVMEGRLRMAATARLGERERISRELHDTLLQSTQALILRFQLAADRLPANLAARRTLEEALDRADEALADGRSRLHDLRLRQQDADLEVLIREIVRRQAFDPAVAVSVAVEGGDRLLDQIVMDEVTRIAQEALFNTWRHARATRVEVRLEFGARAFTLRVIDDGVGITEEAREAAVRKGHFGLFAMRERALKLNGILAVDSTAGEGTVVILEIPASMAYANTTKRGRRRQSVAEPHTPSADQQRPRANRRHPGR